MRGYLELATGEQLRDIYAEFGATEESLKRDTQDVIEWLEKQPHLPNVKDEQFLENFLLRCKNSVERTKKQLDLYYTTRAIMSDIFLNRSPLSPEFAAISKVLGLNPVPKLTPEGHRVWIFKLYEGVKDHVPTAEVIVSSMTMLVDVSLKVDRYKSTIAIYDLENMNMAIAATFFAILKKLTIFSTKTVPLRFVKFYIVNLNPLFEHLITFAKSFMKNKLADRIEIWTKDAKDLVEVLPKEVLPSDYGGNEKSMAELNKMVYASMKEFNEWIESERQFAADLSKKPNEGLPNESILGEYGVEGTFRKITTD